MQCLWTRLIFTARNEVGGKVMFLHVCVILFTGGCHPSMHCRWYPSMPYSRGVPGPRGEVWSGGGLGVCSGGVPGPGGVWPSVMVFCCGLLLWPSGLVTFWFGGLLIKGGLLVWSSGGRRHNRRPSHQKATIPEGHNRREGCLVETTPPGWLLLRAVRILLECILVAGKSKLCTHSYTIEISNPNGIIF